MVYIRFKNLTIDEVTQSSGVFSGTNRQLFWNHRKKINEGYGAVSGEHNQTNHNRNIVRDEDFIDMWVNKRKR